MAMTLKQKLASVFDSGYFDRNYTIDGKFVLRKLLDEQDGAFHDAWGELYPDDEIFLTEIDHYGGEDQGLDYWTVWEFSTADQTIMLKFDGYYQSHFPIEFNGWYEVEPVEVTRIEYKRI